ncbi:MAG: S8 family serine peptidase [Synechococcales cyanobacterium C42_A2020_086]|nr:S8 family serine peptidase [Synechococcales cyanobacterium C42_A2020_086]
MAIPSRLSVGLGRQDGEQTRRVLRSNQVQRGVLTNRDPFRRSLRSYSDDYALRGVPVGSAVEVTLRSRTFRPRMQVLSERSLTPLTPLSLVRVNKTTLRLTFETNASTSPYRLRVLSTRPRQTGSYRVQYRVVLRPVGGAPNSLGSPGTVPNAAGFNPLWGYGLVDAAAAVGRALGSGPLPDVPFSDPPIAGQPNATYFWGLDRIKAPEVWSRGYLGQGVTVAVVDTGIDFDHPTFQNAIWTNPKEIPNNGIDDDGNGFVDDVRGWDFVDRDNTPIDGLLGDGHGTFVAGIIAGRQVSSPTVGVQGRNLGVAPAAKIMPIRVLSNFTMLNQGDRVAAGIRYAVQNGADVINVSLGFGDGASATSLADPAIEAALQAARQAGVVVVMAAGNERRLGAIRPSEPAFAAGRDLGLAVGAIDRSGRAADFSNPAGNRPLNYVVAPGVNIFSTGYEPVVGIGQSRHTYVLGNGTSAAAPYVAGVAALLLSANPNLTPSQVEDLITSTANWQGVIG